jgi:hypothetical protein
VDDATVLAAIGNHLRNLTPPSGKTLKVVYDYPPESLGATPAVVLYPGSDSVSYGAANRTTELTVSAVLYLPQVEYARNFAGLSVWRAWMRDARITAVLLNSTDGVAQASVTSTTIDGGNEYADASFMAVTATMQIIGVEPISASA